MGQLTNLYVSESYQGLIKLTDSTTGVTGTLQYLQDGLGNRLPIQMSTSSVAITGSLYGTSSYATQALSASWAPDNTDTGSYVTTSSFNAFTSSIDGRVDALEVETGSLQLQINGLATTSSVTSLSSSIAVTDLAQNNTIAGLATTSSLTSLSSSIAATDLGQNNVIAGLATTSSVNSLSQSIATTDLGQDNRLNSIEQKTGSFATTGSNIFQGTQTITGSLNVTDSITALSASITYLKTIYQTSSVIFTSGSNILGDEASDTQTLYGTVKLPTGPLSVTGSATISNTLNVQTSLTASGLNYPTTDGTFAGQVLQTDAAGNLTFGNVNAVFETIHNGEATTIIKGTPLYVSGSLGSNPIVYRANTSDPTKMPVTFVAMENIGTGANGRGITLGLITGIDMTGYPVGTQLWVDGLGALTNVRPTGATDIIQPIGIVTKTGAGGQLNILNPGPVLMPNMQTGYMFVGDATNQPVLVASSSLSVASAVSSSFASNATSASFATNALSASYAPDTTNTGSLVQTVGLLSPTDDTIQVTKGDGTTSTFTINNVQSASFATNALSASWAPDNSNRNGLITTGSVGGSQSITGSINISNPSTSSLSLGEGSGGVILNNYNTNLAVNVGGNNVLDINVGQVDITGSLNVSNGITGSLEGTASYATNALSASYAPTVLPAGTISGSAQIVELGFATTSSVDTKLDTGSFNTYTASMDARTGSYATTGSNVFKGDETISGSLNLSGSVYMKIQSNTGIDYVTQSNTGLANFLVGANGSFSTNSGSFVITGSNNFVTAQFPRTIGYINYINGHGNIMLGSAGVLLSTSSIATSVSANIGGGSMTLNFGTSSLAAPIVGNNQVLGSPTFVSPSGSMNAINNLFIGNTTYRATGSTHNTLSSMTQNIFNSTPVFNAVSSSIAMTYNTFGGGTHTINNNYTSSNTTGNQLAVNRNAIFGQANTFNISGSNDASTNFRALNDNFIAGNSNIVNSSAVGTTSGSLTSTALIGANLVVSASNRAGGNDVGAVFLGRNNDTAQGLSESTTTVFAVGTGTSTAAKRTSLHVSSSGLFQIRDSVLISGSLTASGSVYLTGSVQGNVLPLTVASNTASLNLNNGNFFELALTGSQDIRIEPSNIKPGQTVNIKLNTTGSGTVSFPTSVKQPSGSAYTPTTAVGTDIITMVSFDSTNLYVANVKNLI